MPESIPDVFADVLGAPTVEAHHFSDEGRFPNNADLPVLVYYQAFQNREERDIAPAIERVFRAHEWRSHWRDGIFSYHHYHSTAHEVLGVARGSARVKLGGLEGETFTFNQGDVFVLPAGVAHKNLDADRKFLVIGAYPDRCPDWDLKRGRPEERPQADRNIERVELPAQDPVYGRKGPLRECWGLSG